MSASVHCPHVQQMRGQGCSGTHPLELVPALLGVSPRAARLGQKALTGDTRASPCSDAWGTQWELQQAPSKAGPLRGLSSPTQGDQLACQASSASSQDHAVRFLAVALMAAGGRPGLRSGVRTRSTLPESPQQEGPQPHTAVPTHPPVLPHRDSVAALMPASGQWGTLQLLRGSDITA